MRWLVSLCAALVVLTGGAAGAHAQTTLANISCPSADTCLATGTAGTFRYEAGAWSRLTSSVEYSLSLACQNATTCIRVDVAGAAGWTESGKTWAELPVRLPLPGVVYAPSAASCAPNASCLVAGGAALLGAAPSAPYVSRLGAGALRLDRSLPLTLAPPVSLSAAHRFNGLSCPAEGTCLAVGQRLIDRDPVTWRPVAGLQQAGRWRDISAGLAENTTLVAVACATASLCIAPAVDAAAAPMVAVWGDGGWQSHQPSVRRATAASCAPASTTCQATTGSTFLRYHDGAWAAEVEVPIPGDYTEGHVSDISCPAADRCVAVGYARSTSGRRDQLVEFWDGARWCAQPIDLRGAPRPVDDADPAKCQA